MSDARRRDHALLGAVADAFPDPVFVVDDDVQLLAWNAAALPLLGSESEVQLARRSGEVLHCIHADDHRDGCGHGPDCKSCTIRRAVRAAYEGRSVVRRRTRLRRVSPEGVRESHVLVTASPLTHDGVRYAVLVLEDISHWVELEEILPICSGCKSIRDDDQYWHQVETYFQDRLDVQFSHGLCPRCVETLYPR